MAKQMIIAIGREFGSGGHEIAEKLAQKLGIKMFDRNMLDVIASEKDVDPDLLHKFDEKPRNLLFSRRVNGYSNSMEENLAEMQFEYIKKMADSGESFVIVGRCAEAIIGGYDGFMSVFILGDREDKIKRVMEKYSLSESEASHKMNRHDKTRKNYHNSHAKSKWGDSRTYDLCINSSRLGIEGTVDFIGDYVQKFMNKNN